MDLNSILEKNKKRIEKYSYVMRSAPSIATDDRPYTLDFELTKNSDETGNKQVTNGKQTGNKEVTKQVTNGKQTGNDNFEEVPNFQQTGNKEVTKQVTNGIFNGKQTGNKEVTQTSLLNTIIGVQKDIVLFFYFLTKKTVSHCTNPLTLDHISTSLNLKKTVVKTTIIRLQKKFLISRSEAKTGRGGWTVYELNTALYKELMQQDNFGYLKHEFSIKEVTNGKQTGNKEVSKRETERVTGICSSSLDLNYNTTNYLNGTSSHEPEFNLEPLAEIGFTENHAKQILKQGKLTPEEIQESIDHFAFDLAYNDKLKTIKTNPLAFFMGTLKKGDYYNPASNYESQKARNMRLSLEAKMQRQQAEKELEDKLKEVEWKEWSEGLAEHELMEFYVEQTPMAAGIPERVQKTLKRKNALANALEYFEGEVWPQRKEEVSNENI